MSGGRRAQRNCGHGVLLEHDVGEDARRRRDDRGTRVVCRRLEGEDGEGAEQWTTGETTGKREHDEDVVRDDEQDCL